MPNTLRFDARDLGAALDRIIALGDPAGFRAAALPAAQRAGLVAEQVVSEYPPPKRQPMALRYTWADGRKSKFKSYEHQRGFFGLLRSGKIQVPYRRTGRLGSSITSAAEVNGFTVSLYVGTNVTYGKLVIGSRKDQASYHVGWWEPLEDDLRESLRYIARELVRGILQNAKG